MPIKNINLIQQKDDLIFSKSSEQYIQSLANLGQRIGIKGDSPKYGSFTFNDIYKYIFGESTDLSNEFIGYIKYENNYGLLNTKNGIIGVVNKDELIKNKFVLKNISNSEYLKQKSIDDIFNQYVLKEKTNFMLNLNISDFSEYLENSIIKVKNNIMYVVLFVKSLDPSASKIILYYQFDVTTNKLLYNLRLEYFSNTNNLNDTLVLLELDDTNEDSKSYSLYKINRNDLQILYKYNSKNILLEYEIFNDIINYLTQNEISSETYIKLFDEIDISNLDEVLNPNSIFGYFFIKDPSGNPLSLYGKVDLLYNQDVTNGYQYIIDKSSENDISNFSKILNQLHNNTDTSNTDILTNCIQDINNQKNDLLPKIFEYYNNRFYFESIYNFYLRILQTIYENNIELLINGQTDEKPEILDYDKYNCVLYIPVDLEFKYLQNNNNNFEIYFSNDIFINDKNLVLKPIDKEYLDNIIFSSDEITQEKTRVIDFSMDFNNYSDNVLINRICINPKYTLPFIDIDTNNWIINGENSGLSSFIDNYIDQNIIIIYTKNAGEGVYLSNLNKNIKEKINQSVFDDKIFYLNPYQLTINNIDINENISNNLLCHAALPHINGNNFDYFESTLVFSIISNNCIENHQNIKLNDFEICTLWKLENNEWSIINSVNNEFLNLSDLFNAHLAMNREFNFKNYIYDYMGMLMDQHYYLNELQSENNLFLMYPEKQVPDKDNSYKLNPNTLSVMLKFITNQISINNNILSKYTSDVESDNYIGNLNSSSKYISFVTADGKVGNDDLYEDPYYRNTYTNQTSDSTQENVDTNISLTDNSSSYNTTIEQSGNTISVDGVSSYNIEFSDFIFNKNCPSLNFSEVLLNNVTLLNRLNFIIPYKTDSSSILYGAFIGSELDKSKKNIFSIRSSNRLHNLGTQTLINEADKDKFVHQDKLFIQFKEIEMNGDSIYTSSLFDKRIYLNTEKTDYKNYNTFIISGYFDSSTIQIDKTSDGSTHTSLFAYTDENPGNASLVKDNSTSNILTNNALYTNASISEVNGNSIIVNMCTRDEKNYIIIDLLKYLRINYGSNNQLQTFLNNSSEQYPLESFSKDLDIFVIYSDNIPWLAINQDLVNTEIIDSSNNTCIFTFNKEITLSEYYIQNAVKYMTISC